MKSIFLIGLTAVLFTTAVSAQNRNHGVVAISVPTGADLLIQKNKNVQRAYVNGVIDGARVTDNEFNFICEYVPTITKEVMVKQVINEISYNKYLKKQPITFSILNAYHKLYCTRENKTTQ